MARSARSVVRPLMTTDAPDSAKHSATAKPIPALVKTDPHGQQAGHCIDRGRAETERRAR